MRGRAFIVALVLGGCGARAASHAPDGGMDGGRLTGRRSFDVVARVGASAEISQNNVLPATNAFSLTIDADAGLMFVGGGGAVQVVPATTSDGRTFRAAQPVHVAIASAGCPQGVSAFTYAALEVTVDGAHLRGATAGTAELIKGDLARQVPVSLDCEGGPDVKAPFPIAANADISGAFSRVSVWPSEPVPATSKARLVGADGSHVDLVPQLSTDGLLATAFVAPWIVLHPGVGYDVRFDGVVDFAGNAGAKAPLRVGAVGAAPLLAEDGFESVAGATVGGATVLRAGGQLEPIAGAASAFVGPGEDTPGGPAGRSFFVRLPRRASDTKVRFAYRLTATQAPLSFVGTIYAGSVDGPVAEGGPLPVLTTAVSTPNDAQVLVGDVQVKELPLEGSIDGEVLVSIEVTSTSCAFLPPSAGLIIDDLRVE